MERKTPARATRAPYAIRLPGPGLGDVPVADVVDFLRGVVDLVAYAATAALARPVAQPGRRGTPVEDASKVRLVALKSGSLVAELAPAEAPPATGPLDLAADTLSARSLQVVFATARGEPSSPDLTSSLIEFATRMSGRRSGAALVFEDRTGPRPLRVALDEEAITRLSTAQGREARSQRDRVSGRLFEANVETDEAHVRMPTGESVRVSFDDELEPEIKRLLGDRAPLVGDVEYDRRTSRIREIHARTIDSGEQLEFDGVDFWRDQTLQQLAADVDAHALSDPDRLHVDASDAEWDELYRVLAGA